MPDCITCKWRHTRKIGSPGPVALCSHARVQQAFHCNLPSSTVPAILVLKLGPQICEREGLYEPGPEMEYTPAKRRRGGSVVVEP